MMFFGERQRTQAIADYTKVIELMPNDAETYANRGNVYCHMGNYHQAIEDYSKIIDFNPQLAYPYSNRGIAYGRLGNQGQALEDVKTAARLGNQVARNILRNRGVNW